MGLKNPQLVPSGMVQDGSEPSHRPLPIGRTVPRTVRRDVQEAELTRPRYLSSWTPPNGNACDAYLMAAGIGCSMGSATVAKLAAPGRWALPDGHACPEIVRAVVPGDEWRAANASQGEPSDL